ncbi:MAG: hypothetical protein SFT93_03995 [Rickettsiaceae bacterium]|nr:hypothetical protein [Rickettsiaceae bacterium]
MKTINLKLDLIRPDQHNKEVFFNENLSVIDNFISTVIYDFVDTTPSDEFKDKKFIMRNGPNINKICFCPHRNKDWRYLDPYEGMIFFFVRDKSFIIFLDGEWRENYYKLSELREAGESVAPMQQAFEPAHGMREKVPDKFEVASGEYIVNKKISFLYLQDRVRIRLLPARFSVVELIIKQNNAKICEIYYDAPIITKDRLPYFASRTKNNMDYLRLIKLPETDHYLAESIINDYSY